MNNNNIQRLNERFDFYQGAYQETNKDKTEIEQELEQNESTFKQQTKNLGKTVLGNEINVEKESWLKNEIGLNFVDIKQHCSLLKDNLENEIGALKGTDTYKEYVRLLIDETLEVVRKLEEDEVFNYLISENFHNEKFLNEPYVQLWKFKYQPRHWKFSKYANKKAKNFNFKTYTEMFQVWSDLRINFKSLIGDRKLKVVLEEGNQLDEKIKGLNEKIIEIPTLYFNKVIERISELFLVLNEEVIMTFSSSDEAKNLLQLRKGILALKLRLEQVVERLNAIMNNITIVEKMMEVARRGELHLTENQWENILNNDDPTLPIFELIPEEDWNSLKKAFEDKGIQLKNRENYSVTRQKISKEEKEDMLNRYGVKEGEIFIDENLKGKSYKTRN